MKTASKFLDPNTGAIVFKDCLTGEELTADQVAGILPCPTRQTIANNVCIKPNGSVDPAEVESNAKQICIIETTYLADGSVDQSAPAGAPVLMDMTGAVVTDTHEVTDCPADLVYAGEVCYPA